MRCLIQFSLLVPGALIARAAEFDGVVVGGTPGGAAALPVTAEDSFLDRPKQKQVRSLA